jgi:hypothetical protein
MGEIGTRWLGDAPGTTDGVQFRVDIEPDPDATPNEWTDRNADPDLFTAYESGTMQYVGVIVTPVIRGRSLEAFTVSLWGNEYGSCPTWDRDIDVDYLVNEYPGPELLAEVRANLRKLRTVLNNSAQLGDETT